jgi:hypothetical protein
MRGSGSRVESGGSASPLQPAQATLAPSPATTLAASSALRTVTDPGKMRYLKWQSTSWVATLR